MTNFSVNQPTPSYPPVLDTKVVRRKLLTTGGILQTLMLVGG